MGKTNNPIQDMLREILSLACDEVETRRFHNADGAEYDIAASEKDLRVFEKFINEDYLNIKNVIQYAINELQEWNPDSEAAITLKEVLQSIQ